LNNISDRLIPPDTLKAAIDLWGQAGEAHWIPVRGTSMLPLLCEGDQLLVAHGKWQIRRGDIVVFQRQDGLIAHRVLRVQSNEGEHTLRTKGDNVLGLDPVLTEDEVLGRVLQVLRADKILKLDTRLWGWVGRWVALIMLAQAGIYHRLGSGSAGGMAKLITYLSLGILRVNGLCLRATLALFGRWRRLPKM
jgi:hypothetical protein